MPTILKCPCGQMLRVPDEAAGKKVRCPKCANVLDVTPPTVLPVDDAVAPGPPPPVQPTGEPWPDRPWVIMDPADEGRGPNNGLPNRGRASKRKRQLLIFLALTPLAVAVAIGSVLLEEYLTDRGKANPAPERRAVGPAAPANDEPAPQGKAEAKGQPEAKVEAPAREDAVPKGEGAPKAAGVPQGEGLAKAVVLKGEILVGQHRKNLDAGKLYFVKVEGQGFQPEVRVSPTNFVLTQSPDGAFTAYLHPREDGDHRFRIGARPEEDLDAGPFDYTLTVKHVPLGQKPLLAEKSRLSDTDPLAKPGSGLPKDSRVKAFPVALAARKVYVLEMTRVSGKLDPHLALEGPDGNVVATDTAGKAGVDARLYFQPRRSGAYRILASTYAPATGEFTLRILSEAAPGEQPVPPVIERPGGDVIALAGFNDAAGINADPVPNSPYPLDAPGKEGGAGEPGWAAPWAPAAPGVVFQKKVVHEGDGALHLTNVQVARHLKEAQRGRFVVEQYVRVPEGGGGIAYVRNGDGFRRDGPIWNVGKGKFSAFQGDTKGGGTFVETPFACEAGKWHKVTLTIDVPSRTWEFAVDGRKFASPQPLRFRSPEDQLTGISYMCENAPGFYVDAVRVLRAPAGPEKD